MYVVGVSDFWFIFFKKEVKGVMEAVPGESGDGGDRDKEEGTVDGVGDGEGGEDGNGDDGDGWGDVVGHCGC